MPTALDTIVGGTTPGNATPQPLGVAAPGVSTQVSRQDHVHPLPTPTQLGIVSMPDFVLQSQGIL